jgi:hypothetical protein
MSTVEQNEKLVEAIEKISLVYEYAQLVNKKAGVIAEMLDIQKKIIRKLQRDVAELKEKEERGVVGNE